MNNLGPSHIRSSAWLWCMWPLLLISTAIASPGRSPILVVGETTLEAKKADLSICNIGNQTHWELQLIYQPEQEGTAHFFFPLPEKSILKGVGMLPTDSAFYSAPMGHDQIPKQIRMPYEALSFAGQQVIFGKFKVNGQDQLVLTIAWRQNLGYHRGDFSFKNSLDFLGSPDTLQLAIRFSKQRFAPLVRSSTIPLKFRRFQGDFLARQTIVHPRRPGLLEISLPAKPEEPRAWIGSGNDTLPFAVECIFSSPNSFRKKPRSLDVFWDCSFSGGHRNISRELAVLESYLRNLEDVQVRVHPLAHLFLTPQAFQVVDGDATELLSYLKGLVYDGHPTNQEKWPVIPGDEVLLFPGANPRLVSHPNNLGRQVYCLQSTSILNKYINTLPTSSHLLDLNITSKRGILDQMDREVVSLEVMPDQHLFDVQVHASDKTPEVFMVTGKFLRGKKNLNLVLKASNRTLAKHSVPLPESASSDPGTTILINRGLFPTPFLPRLVNLQPPTGSPPDSRVPEPDDLVFRQGILQETWTDLSQWYDGLAPPIYATGEPGGNWPVPAPRPNWELEDGFYAMTFPRVRMEEGELIAVDQETSSGDQIWVQHRRQEARWGDLANNGFWLAADLDKDKLLQELDQPPGWQQSASYLDTLVNATEQPWQAYAALRKQWQASPSFFIDAADHFIRLGEIDHAEIVLSNLLAPGHEAPEVLRAAAHRLQALGRDDLALLFFERVYQARPGIPPVIRDCALALAQQGQWQAALNRLLEALYSPPELFRQQSPGLRSILLTELNHLLAASEVPLDRSQIPSGWVRPLPLDLRVVIDWNRSDTDVDLWVTDPNGEKCNFDLPFTQLGGKLAGDVTDGFGPEAFALKDAAPGKYLIEVEYDDDPELKLSGPSFVKVTIFTDYGRPTEQKQVIPLRLEKTSDQVQVATVEIH